MVIWKRQQCVAQTSVAQLLAVRFRIVSIAVRHGGAWSEGKGRALTSASRMVDISFDEDERLCMKVIANGSDITCIARVCCPTTGASRNTEHIQYEVLRIDNGARMTME